MFDVLQTARPALEITYFLSGIILAAAAIYGLQQVRLMKRDMRMRSDRASKEKAIEYIAQYFSKYVPLDKTFNDQCEANKLVGYTGPIGDFGLFDLPSEYRNRARRRFDIPCWLPALNELQTIAAAFAYGVANDKLGFQAIGRTFCSTVATKYDILCITRSNDASPYYQAIVDLFHLWAPRLKKSELSALRENVNQKLASLPEDKADVEP